jgi:hypothetical protein
MEEDHKDFQDKLNELKKATYQQPQSQVVAQETPLTQKGYYVLEELERMKERLQKARNQPALHPSDKTKTNIVINNPMAERSLSPNDYKPSYCKKEDPSFMERSLPSRNDMDQIPTIKINSNNDFDRSLKLKDEGMFDREVQNQLRENKSINKIQDEVKSEDKSDNEVQKIKGMSFHKLNTQVEQLKPSNDGLASSPQNDKLERSFQSESVLVKQIHGMTPQHRLKPLEGKFKLIIYDILEFENHEKSQSTIKNEEEKEEENKENNEETSRKSRPRSPIVPALQKKLTLAQQNEKTIPKGTSPYHIMKRSSSQIGEELDFPAPLHGHNKSVTNLGINEHPELIDDSPNKSQNVQILQEANEESKEMGKPPLAYQASQNSKSNYMNESVESRFRESKNRKFTVRISICYYYF